MQRYQPMRRIVLVMALACLVAGATPALARSHGDRRDRQQDRAQKDDHGDRGRTRGDRGHNARHAADRYRAGPRYRPVWHPPVRYVDRDRGSRSKVVIVQRWPQTRVVYRYGRPGCGRRPVGCAPRRAPNRSGITIRWDFEF